MNKELLFFFAQRFFFILAIALAFNIRDYRVDLLNQLRTITTVAGIVKTKVVALISLTISLSIVLFFLKNNWTAAFAIAIFYTAVLLLLAQPTRKRFFYSVMMDGALVVQGLVFVLITHH